MLLQLSEAAVAVISVAAVVNDAEVSNVAAVAVTSLIAIVNDAAVAVVNDAAVPVSCSCHCR